MHSDIDTIERIEILRDLRLGAFDVLVGINLLREGLDIPECGLVAILDADKEGFLRSETSLIQTIGRAARNAEGRVIMYADRITGSMERAMAETNRRREKQKAYNTLHGITPQTVKKNVEDVLAGMWAGDTDMSRVTATVEKAAVGQNLAAHLDALRGAMRKAAENLEFEEAARMRDEIKRLEAVELAVADDPLARQAAVEEAAELAVKSSGGQRPDGRASAAANGRAGGGRSKGSITIRSPPEKAGGARRSSPISRTVTTVATVSAQKAGSFRTSGGRRSFWNTLRVCWRTTTSCRFDRRCAPGLRNPSRRTAARSSSRRIVSFRRANSSTGSMAASFAPA